MTGGQALAQQLALEGVDLVFGIPGIQLDHAVDAIAQLDGRVRFWNVRHEQAASYMADGYARGGGDFGVCMVVPGPGLLNAAAGIATAYACSSRVLVISGQLPSESIGRERGLLHEIRGQSSLLASLTKWSATARCPEEIPALVRRAVHELHSGRPRPVGLEFPMDVLQASAVTRLSKVPEHDNALLRPDPQAVERAARLLIGASRPAIVAGGGIIAGHASAALERVADLLQAPVVTSRNGRGALSDRHPLTLGPMALNPILDFADILLVVGSRLSNPVGPPPQVPSHVTQIVVNADPNDLGLERHTSLPILSDARVFLEALAGELTGAGHEHNDSARTLVSRLRQVMQQRLQNLAPQMKYLESLRTAIPENGVLVGELTQVGYVAEIAYPVWQPGTLIHPGYQGTLGFGFPAALGVKAANADRVVVSITGDGGFGWALQELATASRYGLGVITVVFNNNAFANVRRIQTEQFHGRTIASDLTNPDFVALSHSFGVDAVRAYGPEGLREALEVAIAEGGPRLIEVPLEDCPNPWPLILNGLEVQPAE